jgi:ABC-type phosphate transport system auxiliary subunit
MNTEYADIPCDHPIFNHLNFVKENASRYYGLWNKELENSEHWETRYNLLRVNNYKYDVEIDSLKKELQKKKASVTRLKNKIKKMQNK